MTAPSRRTSLLGRFARSEEGTSTVEFVLWVPFMMFFLASMVEASTFMMRWMLLDRSLDIAVRELRLRTNNPPEFDELRQMVCDHMRHPNCMSSLHLELAVVDQTTWEGLGETPICRDRRQPIIPVAEKNVPAPIPNQFMTIRACSLMEPLFGNIGIGAILPKDANGELQVLAFSAYVQEPF